jgi:hypothetical protein
MYMEWKIMWYTYGFRGGHESCGQQRGIMV